MWRYNDIHVGDTFSSLNEKYPQDKRGSGWRGDTSRLVKLEFSLGYSNEDKQNSGGYSSDK